MTSNTIRVLAAGVAVAGAAAFFGRTLLQADSAQQLGSAPSFEVDPYWPRPLPDHWLIGSAVGVAVDSRDHVFVLNLSTSFNARTEIGAASDPPTGSCCLPSPEVLEFNPAGELVGSWGGPGAGHPWPQTPSRIAVDPEGNVWIGGSGGSDTQIHKFSRDGRFIRSYGSSDATATVQAAGAAAAGRAAAAADTTYLGVSGARAAGAARGGGRGGAPGLPPNSRATDRFGGAAKISFDAAVNEAFIADGYRNRRVVVLDMQTGAFKRFWGAYGSPPSDDAVAQYEAGATAATQFRTPVHCAEPSADGHVYVCDRSSNRIQVFRKDGTFVREKVIMPATLGDGAVWDLTFSRDPQQRFMYVADGMNMRVHILDRATLEVITSFGDGGRQPGAFLAVHSIATDSQGNIYTTEASEGKRVQKFVFKGVAPVTSREQGVLWPRR